jgi:hypothetical protein
MLQNLLLLLTFNIRLLKGIPFASEAMGKGVKKNKSYSYLGRIRRIVVFIWKSKKKKRRLNKYRKKEQKAIQRRENRLKRRMIRKKLRVIVRSWFKGRNISNKKNDSFDRRNWATRRRRRIVKAVFRSLFRKKTPNLLALEKRKKIDKEKRFKRYRKKRIFLWIIRKQRQKLANRLSGKPALTKKNKSSYRVYLAQKSHLVVSIHSVLLFLVAYYLVDFIANFSMGVASLLFDYKTVVYYYKIVFLVDYDAWFADSVRTIFATGPLVSLMVSILLIILYSRVFTENGLIKILLLWSIFHGINHFLGGVLIGNITSKGFGYVFIYSYYSETGKLIVSLMAIFLSIVAGTVSTKYWIITANSYFNNSRSALKSGFLNSQLLIPFIVGTALILLINQPENTYYSSLVNISMIFMIVPPLFFSPLHQDYYFDESSKKFEFSFKIVFFSIAFLIIFRFLLDFGLRLG